MTAPDLPCWPFPGHDTIEPGDFIKDRDIGFGCFVIEPGSIGTKRNPIPGYWVNDCHGRKDFIAAQYAVLLHKSDAWWERYAAAAQEATV
jgi:hypothetical protein